MDNRRRPISWLQRNDLTVFRPESKEPEVPDPDWVAFFELLEEYVEEQFGFPVSISRVMIEWPDGLKMTIEAPAA